MYGCVCVCFNFSLIPVYSLETLMRRNYSEMLKDPWLSCVCDAIQVFGTYGVRTSLRGELNCYFIYILSSTYAQLVQTIKIFCIIKRRVQFNFQVYLGSYLSDSSAALHSVMSWVQFLPSRWTCNQLSGITMLLLFKHTTNLIPTYYRTWRFCGKYSN